VFNPRAGTCPEGKDWQLVKKSDTEREKGRVQDKLSFKVCKSDYGGKRNAVGLKKKGRIASGGEKG